MSCAPCLASCVGRASSEHMLLMKRKQREPSGIDATVSHGAIQVLFSFKAALHIKQSSCRLSGDLCVWMSPASSGKGRRTLVSGSCVTGRITSSADPSHLSLAIKGTVGGSEASHNKNMSLELCGYNMDVGNSIDVGLGGRCLHTWEKNEGGKLILSTSSNLYFSDEVAVLFTTLSARLPTGTAIATAAPAAAVCEASSSQRPRRSPRLTTDESLKSKSTLAFKTITIACTGGTEKSWSEQLAARFLSRNFEPLTEEDKQVMRSRGRPNDMVGAATHLHSGSNQCHNGPRFAMAAVEAYKDFLRLKAKHREAVCQIWLDEVWHTHLQDVGTYQRDCATLLGGDTPLIEHAPLPPSENRRLYRATYKWRSDARAGAASAPTGEDDYSPLGSFEDYFWPEPRAARDDDSDEDDDFGIDQELEDGDVVCG